MARVDVIMPQMGESIAEGTVLRYLKKIGEPVKKDEDILEISTDKVDATVPSPDSGVLAEILVEEGKTVEVNAVLARIDTEGAVGAGAKVPAAAKAAGTPPRAGAPAPAPASSGIGATASGQETAATGPPSTPQRPASPRPAAPPAGAYAPAPPSFSAGGHSAAADLAARRKAGDIPTPDEMRRVRSTPLVRRIAAEHNVDITTLRGTGISGRVTKNDILAHIEAGGGSAVAVAPPPVMAPAAAASRPGPATVAMPAITFPPGADSLVEPMTQMRKIIAHHMVESKRTSAHVHTLFEIDMSAVESLRARHKADWEAREGVKLSVLPFILKAAIEALKAFPTVNASIKDDSVVYHRNVHLGVAVALDWGLIVPVIRNADEKNLLGLARATQDLAARARSKRLAPDEVQGSTFTVTNPGIFGGLFGTPIVNQPNVAILGIGGIQKRAVVINDAIAIRPMVYMVLGFDHRLIDGAVADQFMAHLKATLERGTFTDLG